MPIYEYLCKKCGEFEVTQKITEQALTRCPQCRSKVTKLISNSSFQLKGGGWYATDYARKDGAAKDASKPEKAESKPETKSEKTGASSDNKSSKATEATAA